MTCVAVIPARGGSVRVPNKNIRPFHDNPIIRYSVIHALHSGLFDEILVSTDSDEVGAAVRSLPCEVFTRDPDDGSRGTQEVTAEVLRMLGRDVTFACCIYPTAPMLDKHDLLRAYVAVGERGFDYAFGVNSDPLFDAGQFYFGKAEAFRCNVPLIGERTAMIPIDPRRVCDINTEADWLRAEKMYSELHKGE